MPINYSYVDPIFRSDPARYAAAQADFAARNPQINPPVVSGIGQLLGGLAGVTTLPPAQQAQDGGYRAFLASRSLSDTPVTRLTFKFTQDGALNAFYDALRRLGGNFADPEFTANFVKQEIDRTKVGGQGTGTALEVAGSTGLLGGGQGSTGPVLGAGDISGTTGVGGAVSGGGVAGPETVLGGLAGLGAGVGESGFVESGNIPGSLGNNPFLEQDPQDIYRRVGGDIFGPSSMLQQRILNNLVNRYGRFSPITQYGFTNTSPQTMGHEEARFRQFAQASRPSSQDLGARLSEIYGTLPSATDSFNPQSVLFEDTFQNPEAQTKFGTIEPAFTAGIQPFLAGLSPFVQSSMARLLEDKFRELYARQPGNFAGARDVFGELTRRQFLPTYSPRGA